MPKPARPVFLNLFRIQLPVGGWVSIIHRATGAVLVLAMLPAGYLFQLSLASASGFQQAQAWFTHPLSRFVTLLLLWSVAQHLFSGLRHLLLDLDIGVSRQQARTSAYACLFIGLTLFVVSLGVWL